MRIYISGPMTGLPDFNKPAFHAEAARLRALGYQVENPADVELGPDATWYDYMRIDIPMLCKCDAIVMLDGWTASNGARLEHNLAISLGMTCWKAGGISDRAPAPERATDWAAA